MWQEIQSVIDYIEVDISFMYFENANGFYRSYRTSCPITGFVKISMSACHKELKIMKGLGSVFYSNTWDIFTPVTELNDDIGGLIY